MNKTLSTAELREALLLDPALTYLNTGTFGPNRRDVVEAESAGRRAMSESFASYFVTHFMQPGEGIFRLMERLGRFLGAPVDTLALTSGATESLSTVAAGLELDAGDEVLTTQNEHAAGIYPWLMRARRDGIRVREIELPRPLESDEQVVQAFANEISERTQVIAFSHVQYTDGAVLPVAQLCAMARERNVATVVDGAQAVGMLDFDIADLGCDCYAASLHKWLGGPYGTGVLYLEPRFMDLVWPVVVEDHAGWDERDRYGRDAPGGSSDFMSPWPAALRKYSTNLHYYGPTFFALAQALTPYDVLGRAEVQWRVRALAAEARARLAALPGSTVITPADPELSGGIVAFQLEGVDSYRLARALSRQESVHVRDIRHGPTGLECLRVCTHIYNATDDIDRLIAAIQRQRAHA